jgi:hypothetical protein
MNSSMLDSEPMLFGLSFSTHRSRDLGPNETSYFQYEALISAISILFFRLTVRLRNEPSFMRWFFGILLACLAYLNKSYELIIAVEMFSYAVSQILLKQRSSKILHLIASIAGSAAASILLSHLLMSGKAEQIMAVLTPDIVIRFLNYLFPVDEIKAAYSIMESFAQPEILGQQVGHLFFVTFHVQVAMGYIGIAFLMQEQDRRNQLIRLDVEKPDEASNGKADTGTITTKKATSILARAKNFQRGAAPFILFSAMPYMLQIIVFGNINKFAFTCLQHDLHRTVRLNELFEHRSNLAAMSAFSVTSPDGTFHCWYLQSMKAF